MKTRELTGAALYWAVAKAEGLTYWDDDRLCFANEPHGEDFEPSSNWAQGGLIIEREIDAVYRTRISTGVVMWEAVAQGDSECMGYGETPLIAAMRCHVAFQLGDEVDVPKELL